MRNPARPAQHCRSGKRFVIANRNTPAVVAMPVEDFEALMETLDVWPEENAGNGVEIPAVVSSRIAGLAREGFPSHCVGMKLHTLVQEQRLPISREAAWEFFSTPRNLDELTPPDIGFEIISQPGGRLHDGQVISYRIRILPLVRVTWITEIKSVEDGKSFVDEQRFGPYKFWHHRHTFEDIPGGVMMRDLVHYGLGFGLFGEIAHAVFVRRKLESIFGYRREILEKRFGKM